MYLVVENEKWPLYIVVKVMPFNPLVYVLDGKCNFYYKLVVEQIFAGYRIFAVWLLLYKAVTLPSRSYHVSVHWNTSEKAL